MSDVKAFTDDRNWEVQMSGILFLIVVIIIPSVPGVAIAWYLGNLYIFGHLINLILLTFCLYLLWRLSVSSLNKVYQLNILQFNFKEIKVGKEIIKPDEIKAFFDWFDILSRKIPLWVFVNLFAYIVTLEFKSNNIFWVTLNGSYIFINLTLIAVVYSLSKIKLSQVDLIFINKERSILGATLLKVNKDNVRIKKGEKIVIVNKDQIEKIEFLPLPTENKSNG
jgi:hypothetical protein